MSFILERRFSHWKPNYSNPSLNVVDKNYRRTMLTVTQECDENIVTVNEKIESLKSIKTIQKNQMEILEINNTESEIKNV